MSNGSGGCAAAAELKLRAVRVVDEPVRRHPLESCCRLVPALQPLAPLQPLIAGSEPTATRPGGANKAEPHLALRLGRTLSARVAAPSSRRVKGELVQRGPLAGAAAEDKRRQRGLVSLTLDADCSDG